MVGYRNRGNLYYVCGARVYRKERGCGQALHLRKEEMERAVIDEIGYRFDTWSDERTLMKLVNDELRARHQQQAVESVGIEQELTRVDQQLANIRQAVRAGLDDVEWANDELRRLKAERERLLARRESLDEEPGIPEMDAAQIQEFRQRFADVLSYGTNRQKRDIARAFVKRIEVDPDTGGVRIHVFGRPPLPSPKKQKGTPAKAGVPIGMGAPDELIANYHPLKMHAVEVRLLRHRR